MASTWVSLLIVLCACMASSARASSSPMGNCSDTRITYYDYNNNGACGFGAIGGPTLPYAYITAPNEAFYGDGSQCGVCYELTGPTGSQIVMVADMCPVNGNSGCDGSVDHFDLGPNSTTFGTVATTKWGVTMVTKRKVACPVSGNVGVKTDENVSQYWMSLVVFNHRVGVASVQILPGGTTWYPMKRGKYNYWTYSPASGTTIPAPFSVRIASVLGDVITMSVPSLAPQQVYTSPAQFAYPAAGYGGSGSGASPCPQCAVPPVIYQDKKPFVGLALSVSWTDVSFGITSSVNWNYTTNAQSGSSCMQTQLNGWGGINLYRAVPFAWNGAFTALSFWAKVDGASFPNFMVIVKNGGQKKITLTSAWQQFVLPLNSSGLNAPALIGDANSLMWQNSQATTSPVIYMDNIQLVPVASSGTVAPAPNAATSSSTSTATTSTSTSATTSASTATTSASAATSSSSTSASTSSTSTSSTTSTPSTPAPTSTPAPPPSTNPLATIYTDALYNSWGDLSYGVIPSGTKANYAHTVGPRSGTKCVKFALTNYGALQLYRSSSFTLAGVFTQFQFWARTDASSFKYFKVVIQGGGSKSVTLTNTWQQYSFSLNSTGLNAPATIGGDRKLQFQSNQVGDSPVLYLDDVMFA